jgi:hypothetical protein
MFCIEPLLMLTKTRIPYLVKEQRDFHGVTGTAAVIELCTVSRYSLTFGQCPNVKYARR